MNREEVCAWVKEIGLPEYVDIFRDYGIDGSMLEDLDDQTLEKELKISKTLHRKKILKEIQALKPNQSQSHVVLAAPFVPPVVQNSRWIYSAVPRDGLLIYYIDTKKSEKFPYAADIWTNFCSTKIIDDKIYIFGGEAKTKEHMDQVLQLTVSFQEKRVNVTPMASMPTARSCPALTEDKNKCIYVVGGYTGGGEPYPATNVCEMFDTTANKWVTMKPLNEAKAQPALCIVKDSLYCIGGSNYWPKSVYSFIMECLNLKSDEQGWTVIKINDPNQLWSPRRSLLAVPYKEDDILIFGGYHNDTSSNKTFLFNTTTSTMRDCEPLPEPSYFEYAQPFYFDNVMYVLDTRLNIFICDMNTLKWNMVPSKAAFPDYAPMAQRGDDLMNLMLLAKLLNMGKS